MSNNNPCVNGSSNPCLNLGPFTAVNPICEVPTTPPALNTSGSIIPFSSGIVPFTLTAVGGALVSTTAYTGFGTNAPSIVLAGIPINLTAILNEAFSVPRAGTITAISASFIVGLTAVVIAPTTETVRVNAEIYHAPAGTTTFNPTGVSVNLTPLSNGAVSTTVFGSDSNFNYAVSAGDRLLMVFSSNTDSLLTTSVVIGSGTAGITID